jgi:hypothetical protein
VRIGSDWRKTTSGSAMVAAGSVYVAEERLRLYLIAYQREGRIWFEIDDAAWAAPHVASAFDKAVLGALETAFPDLWCGVGLDMPGIGGIAFGGALYRLPSRPPPKHAAQYRRRRKRSPAAP